MSDYIVRAISTDGLVQAAAIILSALLGVILAFAAGLGALSLGAVLVYQLAWCVLTLALPVLKKP